jgi:succinoglycan biosynthesis transport protein ExoP
MLGKMADGILLVVRPGVLDCAVAKSTKMMLEQARSRVLGMVMNGVTADSGFIHYNQKGYYDKNSSNRNGKGELKFPNIRIS